MGYLKLIIGPMFAGKSTELISCANRYEQIDKNVMAINHVINNRYGSTKISTHDQKIYDKCFTISNLNDVEIFHKDVFDNADIIIVEELQFFENAFAYIKKWVDEDDKIVIAAGLDGDSNREPFGDVLKLIPIADEVTKLSAFCKRCGDGTPAHFTKRIVKNKSKTLVGSDDIFEAVCRKHYHQPITSINVVI